MQSRKGEEGKRVIDIIVPELKQIEAMEVVRRVSLASAELELNDELGNQSEEDAEEEQSESRELVDNREERLPKVVPTSTQKEVVARRPGIGEIVHHVGHGYELKVGPEPYPMVLEDRWDEFLNFSAQRQEFAFLLKNEYEDLYDWLREEGQMPEFIHLIESTYREVPPPRQRPRTRREGTKPINDLAKLSLFLALTAILAIILKLAWYAELAFAISAGVTAFIAKYQIDGSEGEEGGNALAILSIIISCAAIAVSLLHR